jgi:hypothetical protein
MIWTRVAIGLNYSIFVNELQELKCVCPAHAVTCPSNISGGKTDCEHIRNFLARTKKPEDEWGWF